MELSGGGGRSNLFFFFKSTTLSTLNYFKSTFNDNQPYRKWNYDILKLRIKSSAVCWFSEWLESPRRGFKIWHVFVYGRINIRKPNHLLKPTREQRRVVGGKKGLGARWGGGGVESRMWKITQSTSQGILLLSLDNCRDVPSSRRHFPSLVSGKSWHGRPRRIPSYFSDLPHWFTRETIERVSIWNSLFSNYFQLVNVSQKPRRRNSPFYYHLFTPLIRIW